jgi:predicted glutamine amidotransferase
MCRIFGAISVGPVYYDLFEEFADLAVLGNTPRGGPDERGHRDGWGIACFHNGSLRDHVRGVGSAQSDPKFFQAAWKIAKTNIDRKAGERLVVLGHLRRASAGMPVGPEWSHPFLESRDGRTWAFAHNGGLNEYPLRGDDGGIDSQAAFKLLLSNLDGPDPEQVAAATKTTVAIARREYGGYSSLNFLLTDGERLHAFREYEKDSDYYTLYYDDFGEMVVVCSQPILGMKDDPVVKGSLVSVGSDLKIRRQLVL